MSHRRAKAIRRALFPGGPDDNSVKEIAGCSRGAFLRNTRVYENVPNQSRTYVAKFGDELRRVTINTVRLSEKCPEGKMKAIIRRMKSERQTITA